MRKPVIAIVSFALGSGIMYFLDPNRGPRRRAILRDKAVHFRHRLSDVVDVRARDLAHRAKGLVTEARSRLLPDNPSREVLIERVRARLGHIIEHPSGIEVTVSGGTVTLRGLVASPELNDLIAGVRLVRGVTQVVSQLRVHRQSGSVDAIGGGVQPFSIGL